MPTLDELEAAARALEPEGAYREELIREVIAYATRFLDGIAAAPAYDHRPDNGAAIWDHPIPEQGVAIQRLLELLHANVDTVGINPTSGRFFGYIPGGALVLSALGDLLAAVSNRYAGHFFASPGAVRMENLLLRWMAEVVGYPEASAGNLTSGGSIANLVGIVVARDTHGVSGERLPRSVVYLTDQVHHCVERALRIAGLGACPVRKVPLDDRYRMDPGALRHLIEADRKAGLAPWMVVASAGTTNTGAVDPMGSIAEIAEEHHLWFHCDGAYGAFFTLCPEGRAVLGGMEASHSLVMDPHKTLFLPYGTGAVLVRDGARLYGSHGWEADYAQDIPHDIEELSPSELSPELTKHFRGLRLWLPLQVMGLAPFRAALSEKILLTRYFHEKIGQLEGFERGPDPELSVATFRYVPPRGDANAFNQRLVQAVQHDGRVFLTSTRVGGKFVLRFAVVCFRSHREEVDEALDVLASMARRLIAE
jgi:glutamate/tyrosine decarboxylase-like PLP-dependent enzyme